MSWDLAFGEVDSEEYWVSSRGDDAVPVFFDFLCANPYSGSYWATPARTWTPTTPWSWAWAFGTSPSGCSAH